MRLVTVGRALRFHPRSRPFARWLAPNPRSVLCTRPVCCVRRCFFGRWGRSVGLVFFASVGRSGWSIGVGPLRRSLSSVDRSVASVVRRILSVASVGLAVAVLIGRFRCLSVASVGRSVGRSRFWSMIVLRLSSPGLIGLGLWTTSPRGGSFRRDEGGDREAGGVLLERREPPHGHLHAEQN